MRSSRWRALCWVALAQLLACSRCLVPPTMTPVEGELRVTPAALDFGTVPLDASLTLELEVFNSGRAARDVAVSVDGPGFSASSSALSLGGGETMMVPITFTPSTLGAALGTLNFAEEVAVPLTAQAVAACSTIETCQTSAFDPRSRACVTTTKLDGDPCTNACLTAPTCQQGRCIGAATTCEDGDACTVDACTADGTCLRTPRVCPVVDACRVASCDKTAGCVSTPVEDGTSCGPETCAETRLCIAGTCETRTKRNAATDCSYSAVAAGEGHTCVRSLGGDVYCWGFPRGFSSSGRYLSGRVKVPALTGAMALSAGNAFTCGLLDGGAVHCAGLGGTSNVIPGTVTKFDGPCAQLDGGSLWCASGLGSQPDGGTWGGANVASFAVSGDTLCIAFEDGSAECRSRSGVHPGVPVWFGEAAVDLFLGSEFCALLPSGALRCAEGSVMSTLADAGVTHLGGSSDEVCWVDASGVHCKARFEPARTVPVPGPVTHLTDDGAHVCALNAANEVWCWGRNDHGQLGERSPQPFGVVELRAPAPVSHLAATSSLTVIFSDGGLIAHGVPYPGLDGGWPSPLTSEERFLGAPPPFAQLTLTRDLACLRSVAGGLSCWGGQRYFGAPRQLTPVILNGPASTASVCGGRFEPICALAGGTVVSAMRGPSDAGGVRQVEGNFLLNFDGGVDRFAFMGALGERRVQVPLPGPVRKLATPLNTSDLDRPCAQLEDGNTVCWWCSFSQGCQPATPRAGVWPYVRELVGNAFFGCALFGANGVRCWGTNTNGQLARDDLEASETAVDIAMPEPIDHLAASESHSCALTVTGRVLCWGDNTSGQLGSTPLLNSPVPLRLQ